MRSFSHSHSEAIQSWASARGGRGYQTTFSQSKEGYYAPFTRADISGLIVFGKENEE
jgi:hypothetical protein